MDEQNEIETPNGGSNIVKENKNCDAPPFKRAPRGRVCYIFMMIELCNKKSFCIGVNEFINFHIWISKSPNLVMNVNKTRLETIKTQTKIVELRRTF
jgi:hypothetical protein